MCHIAFSLLGWTILYLFVNLSSNFLLVCQLGIRGRGFLVRPASAPSSHWSAGRASGRGQTRVFLRCRLSNSSCSSGSVMEALFRMSDTNLSSCKITARRKRIRFGNVILHETLKPKNWRFVRQELTGTCNNYHTLLHFDVNWFDCIYFLSMGIIQILLWLNLWLKSMIISSALL